MRVVPLAPTEHWLLVLKGCWRWRQCCGPALQEVQVGRGAGRAASGKSRQLLASGRWLQGSATLDREGRETRDQHGLAGWAQLYECLVAFKTSVGALTAPVSWASNGGHAPPAYQVRIPMGSSGAPAKVTSSPMRGLNSRVRAALFFGAIYCRASEHTASCANCLRADARG
jgi:hypothetical protein